MLGRGREGGGKRGGRLKTRGEIMVKMASCTHMGGRPVPAPTAGERPTLCTHTFP